MGLFLESFHLFGMDKLLTYYLSPGQLRQLRNPTFYHFFKSFSTDHPASCHGNSQCTTIYSFCRINNWTAVQSDLQSRDLFVKRKCRNRIETVYDPLGRLWRSGLRNGVSLIDAAPMFTRFALISIEIQPKIVPLSKCLYSYEFWFGWLKF